ncbi:MAG: hypothetical protein WD407_09250 [Rhodospirillales bacterium]
MWPKAKLDYFSVRQRDDGGLDVIDPKTGGTETLDALTALVLAFADGKTSTDTVVAELRKCFDGEIDAETVWSAYDRLRDSGLIEDWSVPPAGPGVLTRRHIIGRLGGAVAAASIAAVIGGKGARAQSPQEQEKAAKLGKVEQEKAAKRSQEQKAKAAQEQGKKSPAAQEKMKKAQEKEAKAGQEQRKKNPAQEKQQKAAQEKRKKTGTQEKKKKSAQEQQKKKATAEKKQKSGAQEKKQKAAQEQQQMKASQEQAAKRAQEQTAKRAQEQKAKVGG